MKKFLFSMLFAASSVLASCLPGVVHAGTFQRDDYASMEVPDVSQALKFFREVLDCNALDEAAESVRSALMVCENGMVVELVKGASAGSSADGAPLRFVVSDVADADRWLQREGARVTGHTDLPASATEAAQMLVSFIAPWGQRLQLLGPADPRITALP